MPIPLRADYDATLMRSSARKTKDAPQARRLLALAAIYEGATRTEAAKIGGVTLQIVRDWVIKFNADGPDGLIDKKAPGPTPRLNADQRAALVQVIEDGPVPAIHGVVRWRLVDLCQWIFEQFRITVSIQTLSRELRTMGGAAQGSNAAQRVGWAAEGTGGFQPGLAIIRRLMERSRILKNSSLAPE